MPKGIYERKQVPNLTVKEIVEVLSAKRVEILRVVSVLESLNENEGVRDNG